VPPTATVLTLLAKDTARAVTWLVVAVGVATAFVVMTRMLALPGIAGETWAAGKFVATAGGVAGWTTSTTDALVSGPLLGAPGVVAPYWTVKLSPNGLHAEVESRIWLTEY
jgi:hypothetical protein